MPENTSPAEKRSRALTLCLTFFKIGAFTVGGGYAMLPLIQREIVEKRKWITNDDILEVVAIAESTPGPIAVNSATFVGYRTGGFSGALLATLGVVLPSFAVILAISFVLREFESLKAVQYAFSGIRAGVLALYKQSPKNAVSYALMAIAFVLVAFLGADVLPVIIGCAAVGLIVTLYAGRKKG